MDLGASFARNPGSSTDAHSLRREQENGGRRSEWRSRIRIPQSPRHRKTACFRGILLSSACPFDIAMQRNVREYVIVEDPHERPPEQIAMCEFLRFLFRVRRYRRFFIT
jgi:hypothetical protein